MELHTPDSLRSIHGLDIGPRRKSRLWRWIEDLIARLLEAGRRRADYERLLEMSDRELRDIGISRSDAIGA